MEIPKPSANSLYTCRGVATFIHRGSTPHPVSYIEREDKRLCDEACLYTNLNVGQTFHGAVLLLYREVRPL